jgi:hypothetical protein
MAPRDTVTSAFAPDLEHVRAWLGKMISALRFVEMITAIVALLARMALHWGQWQFSYDAFPTAFASVASKVKDVRHFSQWYETCIDNSRDKRWGALTVHVEMMHFTMRV